MNIIRTSAAVAALVLSLGLALPASALSAIVDSRTQGTADLGTVRVGTDADIDVKVDTSVKASDSASGAGSVRVQAGDVNGDGVAGMAATGTVHGDPDFDFAAVETESSEEHVAVTSKQRARLFGFIPIMVNATAIVDANGRVKVKFPWFAFLMATNKADLEAKIQGKIDSSLGASFFTHEVKSPRDSASGQATGRVATGDVNGDGVEASVKLSADVQARLIAAIQATLQSEFNAEGNARVNKVDGMTLKQ